ncbi:MAG TPA: ATP-binding protein [Candidatus Dormibacteraeota bacterium]|nr:ATP-binding protein [Candidatus Dormibacteraeota bacterium]
MLQRLRNAFATSFATKLLVGGLTLAVVLIGGVSSYLLVSRGQQTRGAALSNSDNRAAVVLQLLQHVTAAQSASAANELAQAPALQTALAATLTQPATADNTVRTLIAGTTLFNFGDRFLAIVAADGHVPYTSVPASLPQPTAQLNSVRAALGGSNAAGMELIGTDIQSSIAAYDVAIPVRSNGQVVGAILYIAPLAQQLITFASITQYPLAFIPAAHPDFLIRLQNQQARTYTTPEPLRSAIASGGGTQVHATYSAPLESGGSGDVAGSFVPVDAPGSRTVAAYVGVEAPVSVFVGEERTDEVTLGLIALFALLITALGIIVFVERTVRRPVRRLERGVARIAGGDYSTAIAVTSQDELGRLAQSVNRMRGEINDYVSQIEAQRARLDDAVERLGGVSRALTTTTAGLPALRGAIVGAAARLGGQAAAAMLLAREDGRLVTSATHGIEGEVRSLDAWNVEADLLAGRAVRVEQAPAGWRAGGMLAVPMFYQDEVVGAVAVITGAGSTPVEGDEQALAVLANNAAIALENTRLFEQERETVRRLRELDAMKSDFLATVQHELRTPLTAILGMSDLLEMCWDMWDDAPKMEAVHDIQMAAKNLYDIVETLIDFSLLEADTLGLNPSQARVRTAVDQAVTQVQERLKGGLPVSVDVDIPEDAEVYADPDRFQQVMRALVDNAVKFTPKGGHVRVHAGKNGHAPDRLRVDVVDDGIGIPEEAIPRIFERFYQVDNSATRKFGGTGMGLALVQRLVQAHGAEVEVESVVGKGTRFSLLWPARAAAAANEALNVARERGDLDGEPAVSHAS